MRDGLVAGKRVVVTGASRGLGRAFAVALAREGAQLVINGTQADRLAETQAQIDELGGRALSQLGSVVEYANCETLIERCVEAYGGIDVLINNAGIVRDRTLMRMSPEEFDDVIAVNLRGTWGCSKAAALAMKKSGGLLLNVISGSAFTGPIGQTNYAAAKAGVAAMTRCWRFELERYGIRANAMWPVAVTDMTQVIVDRNIAKAKADGLTPPTPAEMGLGDANEVAKLMVFLASDRAAALNGQIVTFDGRKLAMWTHPREINIHVREGWALEELVEDFDSTAGREPQSIYKAIRRV